MSNELSAVLALLAAVIVMFAINRPRMDAVALIAMTVLPLLGVVTMGEALAGFSDANIVLIAALFVIGDGLVRTGVARQLGDWLSTKAGSSETRLLVLLMLVVCGLGSTMSSTAVTAIFIPVVLRISRQTRIAPSKLMMPLSMAALISGMTTLVATTPNLIVNSELVRHGGEGFHFFSFTPFGVPILILGILYMLVARRWLPGFSTESASESTDRPTLATWVERYGLASREHRVRVTAKSSLIGQTLEVLRLRETAGAKLVAVQRGKFLLEPTPHLELQVGDVLLIDLFAPDADIARLGEQYALEALPLTGGYFTDRSQDIGMVEVMVPADSEFVGMTASDARIRERFGLHMIGLRRGVAALEQALDDEELQIGDTLLLIGPWRAIYDVQAQGRDLVPLSLPAEHDEVLPVAGKTWHAVFCLGVVVALMVAEIVPNVQAALIGCLLMGAMGCVNLESAYRSIGWKSIVLIVGMLPFSIALQRTGGVDLAADALMTLTSGVGTRGVLAALFITTAAAGNVHFQHRHCGADGTGRTGGGWRTAGVSLSVRDDCRAGRIDGIHDTGLLPGQHAGGDARGLSLH